MHKIYFTSDDGLLDSTTTVADLALQHNISLSFFFVGREVMRSVARQELFRQLLSNNYLEICNHSFTHANDHYSDFYSNPVTVVQDIEMNHARLGFKNRIVRMPGRNAWRTSTLNSTDVALSKPAIDAVRNNHFDIVGWDILFGDPQHLEPFPVAAAFFNTIKQRFAQGRMNTPGHLVVLMHDQHYNSPRHISELKNLFALIRSSGEFQTEFIGRYPGITHGLYDPGIS